MTTNGEIFSVLCLTNCRSEMASLLTIANAMGGVLVTVNATTLSRSNIDFVIEFNSEPVALNFEDILRKTKP